MKTFKAIAEIDKQIELLVLAGMRSRADKLRDSCEAFTNLIEAAESAHSLLKLLRESGMDERSAEDQLTAALLLARFGKYTK